VREIRSLGSVRGVPGNRYLYRDTNCFLINKQLALVALLIYI
jgi:hypothetical protein